MAQHIEGLLVTGERVPAPPGAAAWFPIHDHAAFLRDALADPFAWWLDRAAGIAWEQAPQTAFIGSMASPFWFPDGTLNATVSCLDRQVATHPDAIAYDYVCEDGTERSISYAELLAAVSRLGNALRADGVRSGDRVCIYMPLCIEGIVAMLACARIGAIHSVVYAGLGATALRDRIEDAGAEVVIAADVTYRRGKVVNLKTIVDDALRPLQHVRRVIVWQRSSAGELVSHERDFGAYCAGHAPVCEPEIVAAAHPLFMLYTSGTTGKPKGVVMAHSYLVGAATMVPLVTGLTPDDVYWCTSDIGWIVGHTMMVYGALANRLRCILREGSPDYPNPGSVYDLIAARRVTMLYTAPTLARMLLRLGTALADAADLTSLRAMFCAGEPLNPEAWHFLHDVMGGGRAAVCNHWWQTELAAPALGYFPTDDIRPDRSGMALGPLAFSVRDTTGVPVPVGAGGLLVLETPAPFMFASVWNDPGRYASYFEAIAGVYTAGDVATIDADGYLSVLGRADDVLNVAGHRLATADVESALVSHPACGEAGVIGVPDEIKGEAIMAFVVLRAGSVATATIEADLIAHVRRELGPIATPARIEVVAKLPKTRSGKIMRRLLKAQATGADIGDITTLED